MLRRGSILAALVLAAFALPVQAQGGGAYIGGSVGVATITDDIDDVDSDSPVAWKAFAGYSLGRFIAIEGGYNDFGRHDLTLSLSEKSWGVTGFGVLKINIGPIDLFGKLGMVYASTTVETLDIAGDAITGTGMAYGGGAAVNLGKLGIRAEAEWFDVEEASKPFTVTGGLTLRF